MLKDKVKSIQFLREIALRWRHLRSRHSYKIGKDNRIITNGIKIATRIQIYGRNNTVHVEKDAVVRDCLIKISGNNNSIWIGRNAFVAGAELWIEDNNCIINIGEDTFIGHHSHLACTENRSILSIGKACMLSSHVQIRTGDSHSILDLQGNRINPAADVVIDNHCWIGEGAKILKGVRLHPDTIVATGAIVHGAFVSNVIIAGNPAKIIKTNITWTKQRL